MAEKETLAGYVDSGLIKQIDKLVDSGVYRNKSHAVEELLKKGLALN